MQLTVDRVEIGVDLGGLLIGLKDGAFHAGHGALGGGDVAMGAADDGAENRGAQRTGLGGTADLHRAIADVGVNLHDHRALLGDAAAVDYLLDFHAVFLDAVDDRQRAEGGRLDQGAVDLRGGGVQGLADQQAGEQGVDEDRAVAVVPIERDQAAFAGAELFGRHGEIGDDVAAGRVGAGGQILGKPVEDVADGRLARFQAVHAGDNRAGDDAAEAGDVGKRAIDRGDHHVAGARADDLHQRAGLDARAHGAEMGIERPDRHGNAGRQADALGHLGRQKPGHAIGGQRRLVEGLAQTSQVGIETLEERLFRQAAPLLVIHRLMAGGADAAGHGGGGGVAGDIGGDEVGTFDPGRGRRKNLRGRPLAVQGL